MFGWCGKWQEIKTDRSCWIMPAFGCLWNFILFQDSRQASNTACRHAHFSLGYSLGCPVHDVHAMLTLRYQLIQQYILLHHCKGSSCFSLFFRDVECQSSYILVSVSIFLRPFLHGWVAAHPTAQSTFKVGYADSIPIYEPPKPCEFKCTRLVALVFVIVH